ncbi:MAG: hypothetical protein IH851_05775 [Armatimonadetes bacterium]|nr:hypothetical protein [Armatimonadota bacterium]
MEIMNALEQLRERIERPKQFLGVTFGLNKEQCALLIRRIHASLPEQVKEADRITRESERITSAAKEEGQMTLERAKSESRRLVEAARSEAGRMLEQAKLEREKMLAESEILKLAKTEAEQTRSEAEAAAAKLRRNADDYALDVMIRLENVVSKVMGTVERGKAELQRSSLPAGPAKPK